jgi:hypothetical protein
MTFFKPTAIRRLWRRLLPLAILGWMIILGTGLARAIEPPPGTADPVSPDQQVGQQLYLTQCSSCHVAVPPAVLPRETWAALLNDTAHYGVTLEPLFRFDAQVIWNYLNAYSGPQIEPRTPFRIRNSAYFAALHPQVDLPPSLTINSCISCHPSARSFNFREWQEEG